MTVSMEEDQAALTGDVARIMSSLLRNLAENIKPGSVTEVADTDWEAIKQALDEEPKLVTPVQIDWTQLRMVARGAIHKEDRPPFVVGRRIGVPSLPAFLRTDGAVLGAENLFRVLMWLGYHDIREFCKEES